MNTLTNAAIDHYVVYELSAIRAQENQIRSALKAGEKDRVDTLTRALVDLDRRARDLDRILDEVSYAMVPERGPELRAA